MVKIENANGVITITSEVFTSLAGDAATSCFGVKGMVSSKDGGPFQVLRRESMSKGVSAAFQDDGSVALKLHIAVDQGVNITALAHSIMGEVSYKVKTDEVGSAVGGILSQYTADVQYDIIKLTDETADKLKEQIKKGSPVDWRKVKRRGKYKRSWRVKTTRDDLYAYERTVHAGGKEYRLTHLLEFGHKTSRGNRTKAEPHIAPAAERIINEYVKGISEIVRGSSRYGGGRRNYKK